MDIRTNSFSLENLGKVNIILGKNGCGKSVLLRDIETYSRTNANENFGKISYITPERGGILEYDSNVEQNTVSNIDYTRNTRNSNQFNQFKQQTVANFRNLETLVLREIEKEKRGETEYTFDSIVAKINTLLDNIEIRREGITFKIYKKNLENAIHSKDISSGESELISLAVECLVFQKEINKDKANVLLIDEPDVHLHPDLQVRLMELLTQISEEEPSINIIIASHSTAILGALNNNDSTKIAFMKPEQRGIPLKSISKIYKKILPVFGAHPLSNLFNEAPVLLLEGEDDERIWQQSVRTSGGRIKIYPCCCGSINKLNEYENEVKDILPSVYDNAKAYSLRDRDDIEEEIEDLPPILRMRLDCRSSENLLVTDEVLERLSYSWEKLKEDIEEWITKNPNHNHFESMKKFKEEGFDRKKAKLKEIRNDLMGIIGSDKPWEVAVGQVMGNLNKGNINNCEIEGSIYNFLGKKVVNNLLPDPV